MAEQHALESWNALELYRQRPSEGTMLALLNSIRAWPLMARNHHAGQWLAVVDACRAKYRAGERLTWGARIGRWLVIRGTPVTRPTWNDYWLLYWVLTKDPAAVEELHNREVHRLVDRRRIQATGPEWEISYQSVRWLMTSITNTDEEFAAAVLRATMACDLCAAAPPASQTSEMDGAAASG